MHRASKPEAHAGRLKQLAQQLEYAIEYFGEDKKLRDIDTIAVEDYLQHLARKPKWDRPAEDGAPPETIGESTQRKYLFALSGMFVGLARAGWSPAVTIRSATWTRSRAVCEGQRRTGWSMTRPLCFCTRRRSISRSVATPSSTRTF